MKSITHELTAEDIERLKSGMTIKLINELGETILRVKQ